MFSRPSLPQVGGALALASLLLVPRPVHASTHPTKPLPDMLLEADLVFAGVVVSIDTRVSQVVEAGDLALPHTFVTFRIEELVKGTSSAGEMITLRFLGGSDSQGRELVVAGVPQFQLGDRDVLFVTKNGERMCPLLGWEHGRMRLVNGEVYDALGYELWLAPDGSFVRGSSHIDLTSPARPLVQEPDGHEHHDEVVAIPPGSLRADECGFLAVLHVRLSMLRVMPKYREPSISKSSDLGAPFRFPALRVVKAPESTAPLRAREAPVGAAAK